MINKQSRTADKGWFSSLGLDEMLTTPHRDKNALNILTENLLASQTELCCMEVVTILIHILMF
jgi:hypothetical protein